LLGPEIDRKRLDTSTQIRTSDFPRGVLHMPRDDMYGGLPYRDALSFFDNHSKLVWGFCLNSTNVSAMVEVFEVLHFQGQNAARGLFAATSPTLTGIRWRQVAGGA
jgi:hypothetical protein